MIVRNVISIIAAIVAAALLTSAPAPAAIKGDVTPETQEWVSASAMPLPHSVVRISAAKCPFGGTCFMQDGGWGGTIYTAADYGWSKAERRHILYHELGHAYDARHLSIRERRDFMRVVGLRCSGWYSESCGTPRPVEVFAEQYAACASGAPRNTVPVTPLIAEGDWQFYRWSLPAYVNETALCRFIARWR